MTTLLDRYLLKQMARPVLACLVVTLTALLLERVLRLLKLLADSGADVGFVVQLAANLVPHYLGLALPAAFFISMLIVVAQLGDNSESDAMLASGVSIDRMSRPFFALGVSFAVISIVLFGFVQPYSRFAYRAVLNAAQNAGWDAKLQPGVFITAGNFTITADRVDLSGRRLERVFIRRLAARGEEQLITAREGVLQPVDGGARLQLRLVDGVQFSQRPNRSPQVLTFDTITTEEPLQTMAPAFRTRGRDERELTVPELFEQIGRSDSKLPKPVLEAELSGRVVRALSLLVLPMLAIPMGMASKRGRRAPGLILASLVLVVYNQLLTFGQDMVENGVFGPLTAVWAPFAVFTAGCAWLFLESRKRPGENPVTNAVAQAQDAIEWVAARLPRLRKRPTEAAAEGAA